MMCTTKSSNIGVNLDHLRLNISPEVLDNAFRSKLSGGCFGIVYRVLYDGILCAAKDQSFDNDIYKVEYFQQECLLHSKLHHLNIVRMLGVCYHGSDLPAQPIKIMELLESNFSSVIHSVVSVPVYVKLAMLQDVSKGLDYLHTCDPPIVHSYLNTGVVLLTANLVAKIGGFTFSVEMVPETKRLLEKSVNSTSEELVKSSLYCGPPFDIYSFGLMICETFTKQFFHGSYKLVINSLIGKLLVIHAFNIVEHEYLINRIKDTSLKQLVMNCVNEDPGLRPSASLISGVIANLIKGECMISRVKLTLDDMLCFMLFITVAIAMH